MTMPSLHALAERPGPPASTNEASGEPSEDFGTVLARTAGPSKVPDRAADADSAEPQNEDEGAQADAEVAALALPVAEPLPEHGTVPPAGAVVHLIPVSGVGGPDAAPTTNEGMASEETATNNRRRQGGDRGRLGGLRLATGEGARPSMALSFEEPNGVAREGEGTALRSVALGPVSDVASDQPGSPASPGEIPDAPATPPRTGSASDARALGSDTSTPDSESTEPVRLGTSAGTRTTPGPAARASEKVEATSPQTPAPDDQPRDGRPSSWLAPPPDTQAGARAAASASPVTGPASAVSVSSAVAAAGIQDDVFDADPSVDPIDIAPEAGPSLARAEGKGTASRVEAPLPARLETSAWLSEARPGARRSVRVMLEEGGSVRLQTQSLDEGVVVRIQFSDPELQALAGVHAGRLRDVLEAHLAEPVRLSLPDADSPPSGLGADVGGHSSEPDADGAMGQGGRREPRPTSRASEPPSSSPAGARLPSDRREWIG